MALIRHRVTDWNKAGLIQGSRDICLNATGKQQADVAAEKIRRLGVGIVYTSNLCRAQETALIITNHLNIQVIVKDRLREQ